MDYLRGLAPAHADARHRAVAAPRSRYEIDQPIRAVPRAAAPAVERDEPAVVSMPGRVNQTDRRLEIDDPTAALVAHDEPRPRPRQKPVGAAPRRAVGASLASYPELETPMRTMPVEDETLPPATIDQRSHRRPAAALRPSERATQPEPAAVPIPRERVADGTAARAAVGRQQRSPLAAGLGIPRRPTKRSAGHRARDDRSRRCPRPCGT